MPALKGLRFEIDYGTFVYENFYPENDTLIWKSLKGKSMTGLEEGQEVMEKVTAITTGEKKFMISWVEKTGLGVTQFLDIPNKKIYSIIRDGDQLKTEEGELKIISG